MADAVTEQVNHGGVGPQCDLASGVDRAEPELVSAHAEIAGGGNGPADLDGQSDRDRDGDRWVPVPASPLASR